MSLFGRFRRWLNGSFICKKCGREVYAMLFGYGETICPDCYDGEQPYIFFEEGYWLNRMMARLLQSRGPPAPTIKKSPPQLYEMWDEIEVIQ